MLRPSLSVDRQDFDDELTKSDVRILAQNPLLRVLQISAPVKDQTLQLLDAELFQQRPDVELRVYGHYGKVCDLAFVRLLRNVRKFSADCLGDAVNVDAICSLRNLRALNVGIHSIESFEFLRDLDVTALERLALGATKSTKPSLNVLGGFKNLQRLYLEGPRRNLDPIAELNHLRDLTLRSCALGSPSFLRALSSLRSLAIKLGGATDLECISGLKELQYLELWQVRGIAELSAISELTGLQFLFLQSLKQVTRLPDFSRLTRLRRVYLENMGGLSSAANLETAPVLDELIWVAARTMCPADFAGLLRNGTLRRLLVGFGSTSRNAELRAMMFDAGIQEYQHSNFVFS